MSAPALLGLHQHHNSCDVFTGNGELHLEDIMDTPKQALPECGQTSHSAEVGRQTSNSQDEVFTGQEAKVVRECGQTSHCAEVCRQMGNSHQFLRHLGLSESPKGREMPDVNGLIVGQVPCRGQCVKFNSRCFNITFIYFK